MSRHMNLRVGLVLAFGLVAGLSLFNRSVATSEPDKSAASVECSPDQLAMMGGMAGGSMGSGGGMGMGGSMGGMGGGMGGGQNQAGNNELLAQAPCAAISEGTADVQAAPSEQ